ncbi:patatin-like phospholipase family protein [Novosphingobium sp. 9]|uniref:patatin-like phospholipase family protein n=1 Tax=Novosphingobium sp. 9 TaxID=2025349 RepID=UPI0021B6692A|nr:patatin-like phospholipase family protein [Novosphingobium sp. 9]
MPDAKKPEAQKSDAGKSSHTTLVLQGGGALGAYQAGVYEALAAADLRPDWIAGISIGAVNAAIIAGNAVGERVKHLRKFWGLVSSELQYELDEPAGFARRLFNQASANMVASFGVPGFFNPACRCPCPTGPRISRA